METREVEIIIRKGHGIRAVPVCKKTKKYTSAFTAEQDLKNFEEAIGL